ncbi:MAG: hypothetical protein IKJ57_03635, partial [Oscillospiraceae bacterium]|nr:hypothetical protein [Oscillospiraceae bacterium]
YDWVKDNNGKWTCVATRTCEYGCGHSEDVTAADGDRVNSVRTRRKDPTCCEEGYIEYIAEFSEWGVESINPDKDVLPKDPDNHTGPMKEHIIKHATYTETGLKEIVCGGCGATVRVVVIPKLRRPTDDDKIIIDITGKNEDEENPSTGAPVKSGSALCAMAVLAGAAFVAEAMKKH